MRKEFQFHLGQNSGEFFVTAAPGQGNIGFYFVKRSRQDAINAACQALATHLRNAKTPPKGQIKVERTERYQQVVAEGERPKKVQKFGGLPIRKVTPNETITVSVEV